MTRVAVELPAVVAEDGGVIELGKWRAAARVTQEEIAEMLGVSVRTVQRWESKGAPAGALDSLERYDRGELAIVRSDGKVFLVAAAAADDWHQRGADVQKRLGPAGGVADIEDMPLEALRELLEATLRRIDNVLSENAPNPLTGTPAENNLAAMETQHVQPRRGRGRPALPDERIRTTTDFTPTQLDAADEFAAKHGMSRAAALRVLVSRGAGIDWPEDPEQ